MKPIPLDARRVADEGLTYWVLRYSAAPFYRAGYAFADYAPALYLGVAAFRERPRRLFHEVEPALEARYQALVPNARLLWSEVRGAALAAWEREQAQAVASASVGNPAKCYAHA